MKTIRFYFLITNLFFTLAGCQQRTVVSPPTREPLVTTPRQQELPATASPQLKQFLAGASEQITITTGYDPSYVVLEYPGGDVAPETGVCSDVPSVHFAKWESICKKKFTKI